MRTLGIDLETFSIQDIKKVGAFRYIDDPSFQIMLFGYSFDGEPSTVVDLMLGEEIPSEVIRALYDPAVIKTGWNNAFERYALWKHFNRYLPPEQWRDTMILAAQCGLPLSLAGACEALNMSEDKAKMKEGKALIKYFCTPCKPTKANGKRTRNLPEHDMEKWAKFKEYCGRDVDSEGEVRDILIRYEPSEIEHRFWCLDARINENGIHYDPVLAKAAILMDAENKAQLIEEATALTGLDNPNSVAQIKAWLEEQEGIEVASLNKKAVADVVSQLTKESTVQFMELRKEISKSSVKKYDAMVRSAGPDNHIRGCFQFYGANRTGRFAGRLVQLQNLPKNYLPDLAVARSLVRTGDAETVRLLYDNVSSTLSELIRTAFIPEPGHRFIVSDFSAIEARVIAWFAGEQWRLDVFKNGGDIYCASASQMFKVPVVKNGINGHLRAKGKVAELALGYGGGVNALKQFGADKDDPKEGTKGMTEEEMAETVALWREASPRVVRLWKTIENAAIKAVVRKTSVTDSLAGVRFDYENGILWMNLPSGRRIAYWDAQYTPSKWKRGQKTLSYMAIDQQSKRWCRRDAWGGVLVENLVQATARDCLRDKMLALEEAGFDIRMHIHDEVVITEPVNGRSLEDVNAIMNAPIPWAEGLPLRGEGFCGDFYKKD